MADVIEHDDLGAAEQASIKSQRWRATRTVAAWRKTMRQVAAFDEAGDARRKKMLNQLIVVAVITGGLMFLISVIGVAGSVLAGIGFVATVALFVRWRIATKTDVPDSFREFVAPLFTVLSSDFEPTTPVTLDIDLNRQRPEHQQGRATNMPLPKPVGFFGHGITKIVETNFTIPVFHMEGELPDGSKLTVDVTDFVRRRQVSKKNPRGKRKSKRKEKTRRVVDATLTVPHKKYATEQGAAAVKQGDRRSTLRMKRAFVLRNDDLLAQEPIVDAVAALFRQANPVGKAA